MSQRVPISLPGDKTLLFALFLPPHQSHELSNEEDLKHRAKWTLLILQHNPLEELPGGKVKSRQSVSLSALKKLLVPNWDSSILHKSNSDMASFAAILHMTFILVVFNNNIFLFCPFLPALLQSTHTGREATGAALRLRITPALLSSVMMTDVFAK